MYLPIIQYSALYFYYILQHLYFIQGKCELYIIQLYMHNCRTIHVLEVYYYNNLVLIIIIIIIKNE